MKTFGMCHMCSKLAVRTCMLCGRPVCENHIVQGMVCEACENGKRVDTKQG